ncbi:hypothetical protein C6P91_23920 [Burkholderia multivorans]|nr:hypothetical protein C6P91_23920 [Burkholderia multivorans]
MPYGLIPLTRLALGKIENFAVLAKSEAFLRAHHLQTAPSKLLCEILSPLAILLLHVLPQEFRCTVHLYRRDGVFRGQSESNKSGRTKFDKCPSTAEIKHLCFCKRPTKIEKKHRFRKLKSEHVRINWLRFRDDHPRRQVITKGNLTPPFAIQAWLDTQCTESSKNLVQANIP